MTPDDLRARDLARLAGVSAPLREAVVLVLNAMAALKTPMFVSAALRTQAEQVALYAQGRTAPGAIVTYDDGVKTVSKHQSGHAVDCAFLVDGPDHDGVLTTPTWDESRPWAAYGACAEAVGLHWGGRFKMGDMPHVELL